MWVSVNSLSIGMQFIGFWVGRNKCVTLLFLNTEFLGFETYKLLFYLRINIFQIFPFYLILFVKRWYISNFMTCNSSSFSKFSQSSPPLSWWMPPFISLDSPTHISKISLAHQPFCFILLVRIDGAYFLPSKLTAKSRKSKESKLIEVVLISRQT